MHSSCPQYAVHDVDCAMPRLLQLDGSITHTHPSLRGLGASDSAIRCCCRRGQLRLQLLLPRCIVSTLCFNQRFLHVQCT
jgi:hypothetical protein